MSIFSNRYSDRSSVALSLPAKGITLAVIELSFAGPISFNRKSSSSIDLIVESAAEIKLELYSICVEAAKTVSEKRLGQRLVSSSLGIKLVPTV